MFDIGSYALYLQNMTSTFFLVVILYSLGFCKKPGAEVGHCQEDYCSRQIEEINDWDISAALKVLSIKIDSFELQCNYLLDVNIKCCLILIQ